MMESLVEELVDRTEVFPPVFRAVDPDDFLPVDVRVTVDDVVTCVVVETVSTEGDVAGEAVDEAVAVSAADCAGRLQPAANTTAENAPARVSFVIGRILE
jgi:hypothetical protein